MQMSKWSVAIPVLAAVGCVSQSRYDRLMAEYNSEMSARHSLEDDAIHHQGAIGDLTSQLKEKDEAFNQLQTSSASDKERLAQLEKALKDAQTNVAGMGADSGVEVIPTHDGFIYRIQDKLLFDQGSTAIRDAGKKALVTIAKEFTEKGYKDVRIDGHTDADPVVRTKKEWPLGNHELAVERALAVFAILKNEGKVPESVFTIVGFGPNRPIEKGETAAAKSKNRRVEIHVAVPKKS